MVLVLRLRLSLQRFDRARREKGLMNCRANAVEPRLDTIDKFVYAAVDNRIDIGVCQLGSQAAQLLFGRIAITTRRCSGNLVELIVSTFNAEQNRPGKFGIKNQELDNAMDRDCVVTLTIHFKAADRP